MVMEEETVEGQCEATGGEGTGDTITTLRGVKVRRTSVGIACTLYWLYVLVTGGHVGVCVVFMA